MNATISHPELWTLQIALDADGLNYTLHAAGQAESLQWGTLRLDTTGQSYLQALENTVYDTPFLLEDYGTVRLLLRSPHFVMVPSEVSSEQDLSDALTLAWGDDHDAAIALSSLLPRCDVRVAYRIDRGVATFLQRTFNMAPTYHHLYPLCEHYHTLNEGSGISRMFIHLRGQTMDLALFSNGRLHLANSYHFESVDDAVYYALHTWDSCGLNRSTDEIQLTGEKALRDEVAPKLRRFVSYVMPAIYPAAAMRLSHDVMRAPLDLILLALCES